MRDTQGYLKNTRQFLHNSKICASKGWSFFSSHPFCFVGLPEAHHQVWGEDRKKKDVSEFYQSITLVYVAGEVINIKP